MSRERPAEPKGERTRKQILRRAANLFAKKGYSGAGLQEIAKVAGVTKGSLYWHFEGKRHIYTASTAFVVAAAFQAHKPPDATSTPETQLSHYLKWLLAVLKSSSLARRLLLHMIIDNDTELMTTLMQGPMGDSLSRFMRILQQLDLKKDKAALAFFFYSIVILNDELAVFAEIWWPALEMKNAGLKTAAFLEAFITSW